MNKSKLTFILFILIVAICFVNSRLIKNVCSESLDYIDKIENASNLYESEKICNDFNEFWNNKKKILSMTTHHDILDEISEQISLEKSCIKFKNQVERAKYLSSCRESIRRLSESDNISLQNIL